MMIEKLDKKCSLASKPDTEKKDATLPVSLSLTFPGQIQRVVCGRRAGCWCLLLDKTKAQTVSVCEKASVRFPSCTEVDNDEGPRS